jgi:hypothetical protein
MPRCARGAKAGGDAKTGKATEGDIVSEQEEDSFNLIDWSGDLLGSLTGVSVAVLHNDVTGLLTGAAVGPSVAHAFRYGAKLFVSRVLAGREKASIAAIGVQYEGKIDRPSSERISGATCREINSLLIRNRSRYVYSHRKSAELVAQVEAMENRKLR